MNYTLRYARLYIRREPIHNDIHSLCFQVVTHYEDLLSQATGIEALESKKLNCILYDESLSFMKVCPFKFNLEHINIKNKGLVRATPTLQTFFYGPQPSL